MKPPSQRPTYTRFNEADMAIRVFDHFLTTFNNKIDEEKDEDLDYFNHFVLSSVRQYMSDARDVIEEEDRSMLSEEMNRVMDSILLKSDTMRTSLRKVEMVLRDKEKYGHRFNMKEELNSAVDSARDLVNLWDKAYHYAAGKQHNGGSRKHKALRKTRRVLRKRTHRKRTHRK